MKQTFLLGLLLFLLSSHAAFAEDTLPGDQKTAEEEPAKKAEPTRFQRYLFQVEEKIDFGAPNFLTGWTEILSEPFDHYRKAEKKDRLAAALSGVGEGVFLASVDTLGGLLNVLTAPLYPRKIPLPENGVNLQNLIGEKPSSLPVLRQL